MTWKLSVVAILAASLAGGVMRAAADDAAPADGTTAPASAPAAPPPVVPPTQDELKALMDAGKWVEVQKGVQLAEPYLTKKDSGYDTYTIKMIKGECYLQTKNADYAMLAFSLAEKAATNKADLAIAFATRTLIEKRDILKWQYVPAVNKDADKTNDVDPIDLLDRTKRDAAFQALFADALTVAKKAQQQATTGTALPPIVRFANSLIDLRKLEYAATKGEAQSDALLKPLEAHATQLIATAVTNMTRTVDGIDRSANEQITQTQNVPDPARPGRTVQQQTRMRRGLSNNDVSNLNGVSSTCSSLPAACRDLANALGNAAAFTTAANDANRLGRRANQLLNDNYRNLNRNY